MNENLFLVIDQTSAELMSTINYFLLAVNQIYDYVKKYKKVSDYFIYTVPCTVYKY